MTTSKIFTLDETAGKIKVGGDLIQQWVAEKVIAPSIIANHNEVLFDENDLRRLEQIRNLNDIGYSTADIKKILLKVGLPQMEKKKQTKTQHFLTVGELAKRSGQSARTIKYWEERGLIEPSTRSEGGFRLYETRQVKICNLIHDLQLFGYSLEQIKEYADLLRFFHHPGPNENAGDVEQALDHLEEMSAKTRSLSQRLDELAKGIERWKKLLKEQQTELQTRKKKLLKEREKIAVPAKTAAKTS